jgi:hypothetical protein
MTWVKCLIIALGLMLVAQVAQAHDIESFTDGQGVLHITNHGPKKHAGPGNVPSLPAPQALGTLPPKSTFNPIAKPPVPGPLTLATKPGEASIAPAPAAPQPSPHPGAGVGQPQAGEVIPVTYQTGGQDGPGIVPGVPSTSLQRVSWSKPQATRPVPRGRIVCYRDSHGVMHITNEPWEDESTVAPAAPAVVLRKPATYPAAILPAVQEVSCPELGSEVAAYLKAKLQGVQTDGTGSTIQRYRNHQGVWCILNDPTPEPQLSPPRLASGARLTVPALAHAPPPGQLLPAMAWTPGFGRPSLTPTDQTVVARRDSRGVLPIFTRAFGQDKGNQDSPASVMARVSPLLQACIIEAAQLYQLPISLILALIRQESNFVHQAVSPKGAMGLMQLMPGTAASLGVRDPFDPRENVLAGCRYLRLLLDYFQGSVPLALAGYNAGYRRVVSAGCHVPNINETQEFVTQVMGLYCFLEQRATGL